jgi:hypothetical protein
VVLVTTLRVGLQGRTLCVQKSVERHTFSVRCQAAREATRIGTIGGRLGQLFFFPELPMATVVAPTAPRRRVAIRFSLRVLLAAFSAFAIGFPVWYCWPYTEEVPVYYMRSKGQPDKARAPRGRVVTTWQRKWGGGRWKHGPESTYQYGNLILRVTYRNGTLHGPHETRQQNGVREIGQYLEGRKSGQWRLFDSNGKLRRSTQWRDDRLDGLYLVIEGDGKERSLRFAKGRLVAADGRNVEDHLGELLAGDAIDDARIVRALTTENKLDFIETPLKVAVAFIGAYHEIPMHFDLHHVDPEAAISADWEGVTLSSVLSIIATEHGLGCDYRYGVLWITSAADARNWEDPTGVAHIVPPKSSQLAQSWWNEAVDFTAVNQPLADVIEQQLVPRHAIAVNVSAIRSNDENEPIHLITGSSKGLRFKDGLGILLNHARCRVNLDGETLVIFPQDTYGAERTLQE